MFDVELGGIFCGHMSIIQGLSQELLLFINLVFEVMK